MNMQVFMLNLLNIYNWNKSKLVRDFVQLGECYYSVEYVCGVLLFMFLLEMGVKAKSLRE